MRGRDLAVFLAITCGGSGCLDTAAPSSCAAIDGKLFEAEVTFAGDDVEVVITASPPQERYGEGAVSAWSEAAITDVSGAALVERAIDGPRLDLRFAPEDSAADPWAFDFTLRGSTAYMGLEGCALDERFAVRVDGGHAILERLPSP